MFDFGDKDWALFGERVASAAGIRLEDYKAEQMRRRVATMAQRAGQTSFSAYFARMQSDPAEMASFLDRYTINVSEFFRNPERFADLENVVLPRLLSRCEAPGRNRKLAAWCAGCSSGAEAYSLAILLDEMRVGASPRILATDTDRRILARARSGRFLRSEMQNVSEARLAAYFRKLGEGEYAAVEGLRRRIKFQEHDLLTASYPHETYDLIVCRNVLIYFTDRAKERVFAHLRSALTPGGILFIGSTERLADHRAMGFEMILPFFYRKPIEAADSAPDPAPLPKAA
jgi:chemotaxis protein methyltransferase CheR